MLFSASYANLETIAPTIDTIPAHINPGQQPPTLFRDDPYPGGSTITIDGPAYSAGLSKRYVTLPVGLLATLSVFTFNYQITPSETASLFSQVHENDFRVTDAAGNVFIGDLQKNNQEGGTWMMPDGKGGWIDTGFKPGLFTPEAWTPVSVIYRINWAAKTSTYVSIMDGTQLFTFPASIATVPAAALAWAPGLLGFQNQEGLNALGGCYTRSTRNIGIEGQ